MKIAVFELRQDEKRKLEELKGKHGLELVTTGKMLNKQTLKLATGCDGVTILGRSRLDRELLLGLKNLGVKCISTRTVGYNHIDVAFGTALGLKMCNAGYPPKGVAEFAVMLMLLTLRSYKPAMWRQNVNDYSLHGLTGQELGNQTVGIIGTGSIGLEVIKILSGFGCKIVAYNRTERDEIKAYAEYVTLEELYRVSDIISLHIPLTVENKYFINKKAIKSMKTGVILINTARGELVDIEALTEGIETEKIGALGLDVFEKEEGIYHADRKTDIIKNREMVYLRQFPNVVMTQHMAFYTRANIDSMMTWGIEGIIELERTGSCSQEIPQIKK